LDVDGPAYAVEDVVGSFGRIWRVTYVESNSSEDVIITRLPQMTAETLAALNRPKQLRTIQAITYVVSVVVALVLWLLVWRYAMPRLLGIQYNWRDLTLYRHALGWALLYPLTNAVLVALILVLVPLTAGVALVLGIPLLFVTLLGVLSLVLFVRWSSRTLGVAAGRAFRAYVFVAFAANLLYAVFAIVYAAWLGVGWGTSIAV
jgi:hypothetical protein